MCTDKWILSLALLLLVTLMGHTKAYSNQWATHIMGGDKVAREVANEHGFRYLDKVSFIIINIIFQMI